MRVTMKTIFFYAVSKKKKLLIVLMKNRAENEFDLKKWLRRVKRNNLLRARATDFSWFMQKWKKRRTQKGGEEVQ